MNDNPQVVNRLTAASSVHAIVTSTIVRGEILYGVARLQAGWRKSLFEAKAAAVFNLLPCMPVTAAVADHYARLKADQEKRGHRVDENDLWIAATAWSLDATVVSRDGDLKRVVGLKVIDWTV